MQTSLNEFKELSAEIVQTFDVQTISTHPTFSEAGLDSLDTFTHFMKIEEKYGFSIPEADINKLKIFQDLLDYPNSRLLSVKQ